MTSISILGHAASPAARSAVEPIDPEYARFKAARENVPCVLPDIAQVVEASTVHALSGVPYPVVFRNQGALEAWRQLYTSSRLGATVWRELSDAYANFTECMHEIHWQFERYRGPRPSHRDPADWFDFLRANAI